ncbi:SufE family protein [Marinomonas fungiae]|uniref:Sulfur transfer protein SufE, Fe-S center assembly n=1 Tax=Marinomonas fungiae TaxID=1137284 RepID=A0A0K6IKL3_9GAMM|nr:SufE family protein [Marinomonas fungiae]CUB03645.1 Sulfur transfer protein SufE, Fe-S center assembly [Marinomonas fungiae]
MTDLNCDAIQARLQACTSKEATFKELVSLSKQLKRLTDADKIEENKVKGCESAVWLVEHQNNGLCTFQADSDAKLMRGVLMVILSLVNGHSKAELQQRDLIAELSEFNLSSYLTSSRTNGVLGILKQIQANDPSNL